MLSYSSDSFESRAFGDLKSRRGVLGKVHVQ